MRRVVAEAELWIEAASDMLDQGTNNMPIYLIHTACLPNEKLSMVDLNALLNRSQALLITPPELASLRNIYHATIAVNDDVNAFLDRAKFSANKKFK